MDIYMNNKYNIVNNKKSIGIIYFIDDVYMPAPLP
jgi:hypothetical protein